MTTFNLTCEAVEELGRYLDETLDLGAHSH